MPHESDCFQLLGTLILSSTKYSRMQKPITIATNYVSNVCKSKWYYHKKKHLNIKRIYAEILLNTQTYVVTPFLSDMDVRNGIEFTAIYIKLFST